ncbi:arginine--tRNA ligase [Halomarina oriensis]|uniref:Arginine--tRNA ligase n=1 Tax=Halomarina oriensis TaxID=671145 RepID=A0A6B0GHZ4_9EURY|nr:arginine--tRNA ligase [Halomarina oriensis]MWG34486.1 arginine--tRNA ligase [Halomarina oriensis]
MFLPFRDEVTTALAAALDALGHDTEDLGIEEPPEGMESVLASSVAFRLASEAGAPPPQVAGELADAVDLTDAEYVGRCETQGPYLNFYPSEDYFSGTLHAGQTGTFGRLAPTDDRVVVEHTSANPTGPVHVGRARNPIVGDAVANLLEYAGNTVERHYYVNDAGRQMAVFTWAYETFDEADLPEQERDRIEYDLVRYYRRGNEFLAEADAADVAEAETEIEAILQGLEDGDEETFDRVTEVVDQVLSGMRECLGRLPAEFDEFVRETRFMRDGATDDVVARLKEFDEAVYEEEAWQLDLSEHGIEKNLVFLRSDGTSLYTTRDLAHHEWKFENYDRAVTVLGEDHKLQADQLRTTLDLLGNDTSKLESVIYSYVNLPEGKMSTRAGTGIDLDDLLDEAIDRARDEVTDRLDDRIRDDDLDENDVERIAHQVGIGAVRYDIVSKQPTKAITFEWDQALDFEAQSAPYVQYVHARACGILDEAAQAGIEPDSDVDIALLDSPEERDLLRHIARFPAVVEEAADSLEPHQVATYTREFAEAFNAFYRECSVLNAEDDDVAAGRLALVAASKHAIANALDILGVAAPESM